jgi:hypothetical protein
MADKFDPAPKDKHAADPKQARKADKEMRSKLDKGLEGTFPASEYLLAFVGAVIIDRKRRDRPEKIGQLPSRLLPRNGRCQHLVDPASVQINNFKPPTVRIHVFAHDRDLSKFAKQKPGYGLVLP